MTALNAYRKNFAEAERLLALVDLPMAGRTDSAVIARLEAAGPDGLSLPALARVTHESVAATEQRLLQLLAVGLIKRLETGCYSTPTDASTSPETSPSATTFTTNVLLAALGHAVLARAAAVDLTDGTDPTTSRRLERG
jgi:hypothetical protein